MITLGEATKRARKLMEECGIHLLWEGTEGAYYGQFLVEISKEPDVTEVSMRTSVTLQEIILYYNPWFVLRCYAIGGNKLVIEHIKIQLNHLTLMHLNIMDTLENITAPKDSILAHFAARLSAESYLKNTTPIPCPNCSPVEWDEEFENAYLESIRERVAKYPYAANCALCNDSKAILDPEKIIGQDIWKSNEPKTWKYGRLSALEVANDIVKSNSEAWIEGLIHYTKIMGLAAPSVGGDVTKPVAVTMVQAQVQHIIAAKSIGDNMALLDAFKGACVTKPAPFITRFRGAIGAKMSSMKEYTRYRPNRRFGYKYPGKRSIPKMKYVLAIDTSGSVSQDEVGEAVGELLTLKEHSPEIEVRVLLFHSTIWADFNVEDFDLKDFKKNYQSGGTDFNPIFKRVFEGANDKKTPTKMRCHNSVVAAEIKPTLIIMTDGYAEVSYPKQKISGNIIWALTADGSTSCIKRWDASAEIVRLDERG